MHIADEVHLVFSPLHIAASRGNSEVCARLIHAGAKINATSSAQTHSEWLKHVTPCLKRRGFRETEAQEHFVGTYTALHCAAFAGCSATCMLLIENKGSVGDR